jgi:hypothetical protein
VATYTIGVAGTGGYYNNRGANNPPYNYGSSFSVPNGKCWLVTDVSIQMAGNGATETVYGHIWNSSGVDYWQGSAVAIASDTSPTFSAKNLGDPGPTKLLNNISGTNDVWWVGFSKTAADSVNWDVVDGTSSTATGNTFNGNLSDFSPPSSLARRLVGTFTYTEVTAPDAPVLTATGGIDQVALSWTAPATGGVAINEYTLKRGTTTLYTGTDRTFTDTGRADGTSYSYSVYATNNVGDGDTDTASATTFDVPSVVQSLTATPGVRQVVVDWTTPASNGGESIDRYDVYRLRWNGSSWVESTLIYNLGPTATTATGLANNTTYLFHVYAVNGVGSSAVSEVQATTPALPGSVSGLSANASTFGVVGLSWTASSTTAGYTVTYTISRNGTTLGTTTGTTFSDTTVAPSQAYTYTVTPSNAVGTTTGTTVSVTSLGGIARVWNGTNWTTRVALVKVCTNTAGAQVWTLAQARVWDGNEWKYGI